MRDKSNASLSLSPTQDAAGWSSSGAGWLVRSPAVIILVTSRLG
jgi:hypothetical protein